jgi:hypothetical protein
MTAESLHISPSFSANRGCDILSGSEDAGTCPSKWLKRAGCFKGEWSLSQSLRSLKISRRYRITSRVKPSHFPHTAPFVFHDLEVAHAEHCSLLHVQLERFSCRCMEKGRKRSRDQFPEIVKLIAPAAACIQKFWGLPDANRWVWW